MSRIVRHHADRTNQKLYFARLAYQHAKQAQNENIQHYQAYREECIFHLHGVITAFLQELVRFYRLNDATPSFESIEQALAINQQISPEINQLKQLSQTGFLKVINQAYQASLYTPAPTPIEPETENNLIIKAMPTQQHWLPEVETLQDYHQQLLQLIESFRNEMVEF